MNKILFLILCTSLFPFHSVAQPTINWEKSFGGTQDELGYSIIQTNDGGYIVAGSTTSNDNDVSGNHGIYSDFWVIKMNNIGTIQWQKCYGGTNNEGATSIIQTTDGGYAIAGYATSTDGDVTGNHGGQDYWVVKINSGGTIQWEKSYGGSGEDYASKIIQTYDGGYTIIGYTYSGDGDVTGYHGSGDCWLVKTDNAGTIQWQKCYGGSRLDQANSFVQTADSGFAIAGLTNSSDGDVTGWHNGYDTNVSYYTYDYWIVKTNAIGNIQWEKSYGGSWYDEANSILQTNDRGYIVAGESGSIDGDVTGDHSYSNDAWVIKLDSSGTLKWEKCYGGSNEDWANSIFQDNDGGYVFAGATNSSNGDVTGFHGDVDYWIVKIDTSGSIIWKECLGGTGGDEANAVIQTSDNGYAIAGWSKSIDGEVTGNHGNWDYWIVKLNSYSGIDEINNSALSVKIYPNPFSTSATMIINAGEINNNNSLHIYDMIGQEIRIINIGNNSQATIDREQLSSGMYFYKLVNNDNEILSTGKFVIVDR